MKLIFNLLVLSTLIYSVYSQSYSIFHITGPGCKANGEDINLNECTVKICGGAGSDIVFDSQSNYTLSLYFDNQCLNSADSIEFECPNDETSVEIGSYYVSCHDSSWVPVNYKEFTVYGEGCDSNGESLSINSCSDICGSYAIVNKDIETGDYTIQLAYDSLCSSISDDMDFACLSDNQAVKIGDYGIVCSDPSSASSFSSSSSDQVLYTSFLVNGEGCPTSGEVLDIYDCDAFCGGYAQFSLNDSSTNTYNIAMSYDSNCQYILESAQINCLPNNQYVQVGPYYIVCQSN